MKPRTPLAPTPHGGRPSRSACQRSAGSICLAATLAAHWAVSLAADHDVGPFTALAAAAVPEGQLPAAQPQTASGGPAIRLTGPRAQDDRWQLVELARATPADPELGDRPPAATDSTRHEVHFHSTSGIGGAAIEVPAELLAPRDPRPLTLVLHLRGLEQLTLRSADLELRVAVSHSPPWTARTTKLGPNQSESPLDPADRLAPRVECVTEPMSDQPNQARAFRVELPAELLPRLNRPLTVHWIDFFRQ